MLSWRRAEPATGLPDPASGNELLWRELDDDGGRLHPFPLGRAAPPRDVHRIGRNAASAAHLSPQVVAIRDELDRAEPRCDHAKGSRAGVHDQGDLAASALNLAELAEHPRSEEHTSELQSRQYL